jgi:hypothetical protein
MSFLSCKRAKRFKTLGKPLKNACGGGRENP